MYHVSAQGVDERMINVHYYYYLLTCITQNLARRRTASTGDTHVRTFRGATVAQLINIISTGACYPQVEQVAVTTGTNDCAGNKKYAVDATSLLTTRGCCQQSRPAFQQLMVQQRQSLLRLSGDLTNTIAALNKG